MKRQLTILAAVLAFGLAQAGVVTFTPAAYGEAEGVFGFTLDNEIRMEVSDGSCSSAMLTLRNGGATLAFSSVKAEPITSIRITVVSGDPANRISGSGYVAAGEVGTWTGSAAEVTLANNSVDWVGIRKIEIATSGSALEDEEDLLPDNPYVFDCSGTVDGTDSLVVHTPVATFVQHRGDGKDRPAYVSPWRIYKGNTVTIRMEEGYVLQGVEITVAAGRPIEKLDYSVTATGTQLDDRHFLIGNLPGNVTEFTITNTGDQTRWDQIAVSYALFDEDASVAVSPGRVDFGSFTVGNRNSRTITVNAQKAVSLESVSVSAPFAVEGVTPPASLEAGESLGLTLSVQPEEPGTFKDTLCLAFADTICKIPLKVNATALAFGASEGAFPTSHGYLYDANGDGRMEYFADKYPYVEQYSFDGSRLATIPTWHYLFALEDMNRDGELDLVCSRSGDKENPGGVYVHGLDGTLRHSFPALLDGGTHTVMFDANSDGRSDFYLEEVLGNISWDRQDNRHVIYYQQPDGSFVRREPTVLSDPEEVENALFAQYGANPTVTQPVNFSGLSLAKRAPAPGRRASTPGGAVLMKTRSAELFYGNTSPTAVDVNMDGYPDLINLNNGDALLSIGDGTYYYGSFEGQTTVKDLNGDGMPDFVLYDEASRTVTLFLYEGNNSFAKQTLMQNFNITGIHTFDFDRDGDVDILLPFDYTDRSMYAYLVFFENQGDNVFRKRERTFDMGRKLSFIGGGDVDNDGRFEVVCREGMNIFLIDCDPAFDIGEESGVIATVPDPASYQYEGEYNFIFGDFNNDGLTEWWGGINFDSSWTGATPYSTREVGQFAAVAPNTAPQKQGTPSFVYDAAINMLRVEWPAGTDAENSACDLTYALRVGTEPGRGDVWYAHADANGRRLRPGAGNAGYNTYALLSTAGWTKGTYHIAVQAVDANGLGGEWSDEVQFEYTGLNASFLTSVNEINLMDTLVLSTSLPYDETITYTWDFGDGGREVKREDNRRQVVYDRAGRKTLGLTMTDADGLMAVATEQTVDVYPIDWAVDSLTHDRTQYSSGLYLDLDGNGSLDLVGSSTVLFNGEVQNLEGVFENRNNDNRFSKVGRTYNSDLQPSGDRIVPMDFNMDGTPDFMGSTNKGNVFINLGSFDFEYSTKAYNLPACLPYDYCLDENMLNQMLYRADFNNDGYLDVWYGDIIGMNQGDNLTFTRLNLDENGVNESADMVFDFDRDGYVDVLVGKGDQYPSPTRHNTVLYKNRGDGTFEEIVMYSEPVNRDGIPNRSFLDLNNDGWPDMVWSVQPQLIGDELETGSIHIILGDASLNYMNKKEIVMEGYALDANVLGEGSGSQGKRLYDMDNNGWCDLPVTVADGFTIGAGGGTFLDLAGGVLYFYPNWETVFEKGNNLYVNAHKPFADLNGDGRPDASETSMVTKHTNEAPAAPANVRAVQQGDGVLLQWDAAVDKETPAAHLRYNLSLKRKGARGDNSYILSPLNEGSDRAAAIPGYPYRNATRLTVPLSRFTPGEEYELKVQTIDLWNAHSPFSETFTFRVERQVAIDAPAETCTEQPVTIVYKGTESGTPQWSAGEGGEVLEADGNAIDMMWRTPGVKTIGVTVNGMTSERSIMVNAAPDLGVELPAGMLLGGMVHFTLPEAFGDPSKSTRVRTSLYRDGEADLPVGSYNTDDNVMMVMLTSGIWTIGLEQRSGSLEARLCVQEAGKHWIDFVCDDPVCGETAFRHEFDVTDVQPAITLVGVNEGKNCVYWSVEAAQATPVAFEQVLVYREMGATNNFVLIGEVPVADGMYTDLTSDPAVRKSRYCIALRTADGVTTARSEVHGSVHIMLNQGLAPNSVNIVWTAYEGGVIDEYTILRGTSPDALEVLTTASGYETSFTDLQRPDGDVYYALQYSKLYEGSWTRQVPAGRLRLATKAAPALEGRSNVVNANASATITMADKVNILVVESNPRLTPAQTELHLYAEVLPAAATYKRVNWQILSGGELATLTDAGVLTYAGKGANGTVRVQASTIDGTKCTAVRDIAVSGFGGEPPAGEAVLTLQAAATAVPGVIYRGEDFTVSSVLQNTGTADFSGNICVGLLKQGDQQLSYNSSFLPVSVNQGAAVPFNIDCNVGDLAAGEYQLGFGTVADGYLSWIDFDGGGNVLPVQLQDRQSGMDTPTDGIWVYNRDLRLVIVNAEGLTLDLFDLAGRHMKHVDKAAAEESVEGLDTGVYILHVKGKESRKVVVH